MHVCIYVVHTGDADSDDGIGAKVSGWLASWGDCIADEITGGSCDIKGSSGGVSARGGEVNCSEFTIPSSISIVCCNSWIALQLFFTATNISFIDSVHMQLHVESNLG